MKITEQTTLGELAAYLTQLGSPLVHVAQHVPRVRDGRVAIVGSYSGEGVTIAEALEAAVSGLRRALPSCDEGSEP